MQGQWIRPTNISFIQGIKWVENELDTENEEYGSGALVVHRDGDIERYEPVSKDMWELLLSSTEVTDDGEELNESVFNSATMSWDDITVYNSLQPSSSIINAFIDELDSTPETNKTLSVKVHKRSLFKNISRYWTLKSSISSSLHPRPITPDNINRLGGCILELFTRLYPLSLNGISDKKEYASLITKILDDATPSKYQLTKQTVLEEASYLNQNCDDEIMEDVIRVSQQEYTDYLPLCEKQEKDTVQTID